MNWTHLFTNLLVLTNNSQCISFVFVKAKMTCIEVFYGK